MDVTHIVVLAQAVVVRLVMDITQPDVTVATICAQDAVHVGTIITIVLVVFKIL